MTISSETLGAIVVSAVQTLLLLATAPFLVGLLRQVRAKMEGRIGAGIAQPWRDLRKLLGKDAMRPEGSSWVFTAAPVVLLASTVVIVAAVPLLSTVSPTEGVSDLFAIVALLMLGTVFLALAALDTGTAFGGIGASRGMTIAALTEPTILLAVFALSIRVGSSNLATIVEGSLRHPSQVLSPASLLAAIAFVVVIIAETGRLPIDNPATHLELTMVHEAQVLEYSGRDLAMVEYAASLRLAVLAALGVNLFLPWGIATALSPGALLIATGVLIAKVAIFGVALSVFEVLNAKWRLFRIPELLAGSFLFGLLAVSASFFLA